jgi:hypothetical protein
MVLTKEVQLARSAFQFEVLDVHHGADMAGNEFTGSRDAMEAPALPYDGAPGYCDAAWEGPP